MIGTVLALGKSKYLMGKSAVHSRDENKEELDFSTCLSLTVGIWVWAAQ